MRGLTFHGSEDVRVEDVEEPTILAPTDALVRITMAAICGSDLHVYHVGGAFGFEPGTRLGHEFIGTVEAVGSEVTGFAAGDRVLAAVLVSCGSCTYCRDGLRSSCLRLSPFGWAGRTWQHGGPVQGGQSEFARVPLADSTLYRMPESLSGPEHETTMLPLVDMMSTGWHGLEKAGVQPGHAVVVIGDGAVGLGAVHGARARGAEPVICLGHHADRLETAIALGASATIDSRDTEEIREKVMELTGGEGAHAVIDTISGTSSMEAAHACVRAGGTIATLGMDHFTGNVPTVNWIDQWLRNVTIAGGYVPGGHYLPKLLELAEQGRVQPSAMLSHHLPLDQAPEGYRLMHERAPGVIKVALRPGG